MLDRKIKQTFMLHRAKECEHLIYNLLTEDIREATNLNAWVICKKKMFMVEKVSTLLGSPIWKNFMIYKM